MNDENLADHIQGEALEYFRDKFFKATNIDLFNLERDEVRDLLELLPVALIYIHGQYDMSVIYKRDEEGDYER
jgi:hypothetical protein